jgi:hypothetical protein
MSKFQEKAKCVHDFIGTLSKENPKIAEGFVMMHKAAGEDKALSNC